MKAQPPRNSNIKATAFRYSIDKGRACLIEENSSADSPVLVYRYADTGDCVAVPNTWYNMPPKVRIEALLARADLAEQRAIKLANELPDWMDSEGRDQLIQRHIDNARRNRQLAGDILING